MEAIVGQSGSIEKGMDWMGRRQMSEKRKSGGVFDLYLPGQAIEHAPATPFPTPPSLVSPMQRIANAVTPPYHA